MKAVFQRPGRKRERGAKWGRVSWESGEDGGGLRGGGGGQGWAWGRTAKVSGGAEYTSTLGHAKDQAGKRGRTSRSGEGGNNGLFLQTHLFPPSNSLFGFFLNVYFLHEKPPSERTNTTSLFSLLSGQLAALNFSP